MPRSMGHPDYRYQPISAERRARLSEIHRKRWGAPEGCATIRGVHVPFKHRDALRYWSDHVAYHHGEEAARRWIEVLREGDWGDMPRIWRLYRERKAIARTRDTIRLFQWEIAHGNRNNT